MNDEAMVVEILNIIAKSDQIVFLERENCLQDIVKIIHLIIGSSDPKANKDQMLIAVKMVSFHCLNLVERTIWKIISQERCIESHYDARITSNRTDQHNFLE